MKDSRFILMLDFTSLFEFSRSHCVAICTFLVPANLLATSLTMFRVGLRYPSAQVWQAVGLASFFALVMIFHVLTWFMVGVVMAPTYILLLLGSVCLSVNLWAIAHPTSMSRVLRACATPLVARLT